MLVLFIHIIMFIIGQFLKPLGSLTFHPILYFISFVIDRIFILLFEGLVVVTEFLYYAPYSFGVGTK